MDSLLVSTGIVAIAEIGDKTQLLALVLAARFRKPWPIIAGILLATIANHALAAALGGLAADWIGPGLLTWVLAVSFLAMAVWVLVPDKEDDCAIGGNSRSAFLATLIAFFLVEMGDKTQVATIALAARYQDIALVTMGTTLGMMIANVPAVLLGEVAATKIPLKLVRSVASAVFAVLGALALAQALGVQII